MQTWKIYSTQNTWLYFIYSFIYVTFSFWDYTVSNVGLSGYWWCVTDWALRRRSLIELISLQCPKETEISRKPSVKLANFRPGFELKISRINYRDINLLTPCCEVIQKTHKMFWYKFTGFVEVVRQIVFSENIWSLLVLNIHYSVTVTSGTNVTKTKFS
jgi:hypothetical protein